MITLDGKQLAETHARFLQDEIQHAAVVPHLVIFAIGNDPASEVYIERKKSFGNTIGARVTVVTLDESVNTTHVITEMQKHNINPDVHGIIVQLPVPAHIDKEAVINTISPDKDVDGLTAINMWRLMDDARGIVPATARGIEALLHAHHIPVQGAHVVIVGDSLLVGKSTAVHFLNQDATVTICHDQTKRLATLTKQADILMVAVGKPGLITREHVVEGQVVIDIGITRLNDGTVVGDVLFEQVKDVVHAITPVPGGVGPMTVVSLFENLINTI